MLFTPTGRARLLSSTLAACLVASVSEAAPIPAADSSLLGWNQTGFTLIVDGTSNTILFGESTTVSVCLTSVGRLPELTDGTSNTIFLGELEDVCFDEVQPGPGNQLVGITDGTSNTILFGENAAFWYGPSSRVKVCASERIVDGNSNTILLGETQCFADLQIAPAEVTEPATLTLLSAGALAGWARRRWRLPPR
jgi:hypothetical protein